MKWEKKTINEVCDVGDGAHASIKRVFDGFQYLTSKNFKLDGLDLNKVDFISEEDYLKHFKTESKAITKPKTNDVLLSIIGSLGAPYLVKEDDVFGLSSSVSILRPKIDKIEPKFLYYWIKSNEFQSSINNIKSGVAQSFLSLGMIKSLPVIYPKELPTQQRIASILSAYDDLIENNLKRIKLLEEKAQLHYKIEFGDYQFGDKEPQNLPKGWSIKHIGDIYGKLESGTRPKGGIDKELKEGIASVGAENVIGLGKYNYQSEKLITEAFFENMNRGRIENKDILIYKDGAYIGKTTLFQDDFPHQKCCVNEHVFLLRSKDELYQNYLFFTLYQKLYFDKMQQLNANAAQPGINQESLKSLRILWPSENVIEEFNKNVESLMKLIFVLAKQNTKLREARDILLPRLMSGQIEV